MNITLRCQGSKREQAKPPICAARRRTHRRAGCRCDQTKCCIKRTRSPNSPHGCRCRGFCSCRPSKLAPHHLAVPPVLLGTRQGLPSPRDMIVGQSRRGFRVRPGSIPVGAIVETGTVWRARLLRGSLLTYFSQLIPRVSLLVFLLVSAAIGAKNCFEFKWLWYYGVTGQGHHPSLLRMAGQLPKCRLDPLLRQSRYSN
jgi:hypothetical protein